jgi:hypothetical protein
METFTLSAPHRQNILTIVQKKELPTVLWRSVLAIQR